ncbi:MAG: methyltransferase domain-containing protein, partial [Gemmatimonadales bacterium]
LTHMHESWAGEDHPIDDLSRGWASSALRRYSPNPSPVILEVGCSSGFLLEELRARWPAARLIGADVVKEPLDRLAARVPGIPLLQFDLTRCPLPSESVDTVVLLNVLEHIEDDRGALREVARILRPGGVAVIEVPAGPKLYDVYDEYLRHHRRYSASGLARSLEEAGLTRLERSHLGCLLYPAFALAKHRNQRATADDVESKRRSVEASIAQTRRSAVVRVVLHAEAWLGRHVSFPFGIRCVAVARKPLGARS